MLPDEIDGDDRMGTSSRRGKMEPTENFSVDESMYIENSESMD